MREKQRTRGRPEPTESTSAGGGTADWVLTNEAGWGFPHGLVVLLAGFVVGARAIGWLVWRIAAAIDRARARRRP